MADPPYSPLEQRVAGGHAGAIEDVADATGKKRDVRLQHHRRGRRACGGSTTTVRRLGGTCVMVSVDGRGSAGASPHLRAYCELPIHGHRNGLAPAHASPVARHRVPRPTRRSGGWPGSTTCTSTACDSKFWEPDESVVDVVRACLEPLFDDGDRALPVPARRRSGPGRRRTTHAAGRHGTDVSRRRRDHRPPGRAWRPASPHPAGVGGRRFGRAARDVCRKITPSSRAAIATFGATRWRRTRRCSPSTATTSPARPTRSRRSAVAGVSTVLFLEPPSADTLARFPASTRSASRARRARCRQARCALRFPRPSARLAGLGAPHRPLQGLLDVRLLTGDRQHRGALEIGAGALGSRLVPLVVGSPVMGRYCVFGNLFASAAPSGPALRIDRHPDEQVHPVTPMDES